MPTKQTEWSRAYNARAYDRLAITVPKGRLADIKAEADRMGLSVNGLVNALLMKQMGIASDDWSTHKQTAPGE